MDVADDVGQVLVRELCRERTIVAATSDALATEQDAPIVRRYVVGLATGDLVSSNFTQLVHHWQSP